MTRLKALILITFSSPWAQLEEMYFLVSKLHDITNLKFHSSDPIDKIIELSVKWFTVLKRVFPSVYAQNIKIYSTHKIIFQFVCLFNRSLCAETHAWVLMGPDLNKMLKHQRGIAFLVIIFYTCSLCAVTILIL